MVRHFVPRFESDRVRPAHDRTTVEPSEETMRKSLTTLALVTTAALALAA